MSFTNFLFNGVNGQLNRYIRDNYQKDSYEYGKTDSFQGRQTRVLDLELTKKIWIDDAYTISTVSDSLRENCTNLWQTFERHTKITFKVCLIGGLAGIATAIGLGLAVPPLAPLALAVGVISLAVLCFSYLPFRRSLQAHDQRILWEDRTEEYIQQFRDFHEKGQTERRKLQVEHEENIRELKKNHQKEREELREISKQRALERQRKEEEREKKHEKLYRELYEKIGKEHEEPLNLDEELKEGNRKLLEKFNSLPKHLRQRLEKPVNFDQT